MAAKIFASVFPGEVHGATPRDLTRRQLLSTIRPAVVKALSHEDPYDALEGVVDILRQSKPADQGFVAYGLPQAKIMSRLVDLLKEYGRIVLGIHDDNYEISFQDTNGRTGDGPVTISYKTRYAECVNLKQFVDYEGDFREPVNVTDTREGLFMLLLGMQEVGLGGTQAQKAFALVMDELLTEFVEWSYGNTFDVEPELPVHLKYWIENVFARFVVQVLDIFRASGQGVAASPSVTFADVEKWQEMGITRVGKLRTSELFDIIVGWDATKSGIDDLKHYTTNPATRSYVTSHFTNVLSQRLLQPGASTMEILQVYISIIRAFRHLDPRGVLLDRVARPTRHYLRTREDTVRIVVNGILADVELDEDGTPVSTDASVLWELAVELKSRGPSENDNEGELDWNNMDWTPDPIDAAPDYKKSKTADVVGSLISLFDSKEVFVKELQNALAERLLLNKSNFDQEIGVLEHLKIRFGDAPLQACEVMLRDVLDSRRTDTVIRNDQSLVPQQSLAEPVTTHERPLSNDSNIQIHAKILSRLFWPTQTLEPPDDPDTYDDAASFLIPSSVSALQETYSKGFESLKQSRKLTWLNNLGHVTVELDLEDRIFQADDITPMQASVIYAFQDSSATPTTKTIDELSSTLQLPPFFVRTTCQFWVTKQILTPTPSTALGTSYTVLERLPITSSTPSKSQPQQPPSSSIPSTPIAPTTNRSTIPPAKAALYNQFIISMLTNQGSMPLARIGMMLGIVVPGGWGYGNEELRELLVGLQTEGKVEMGNGGVWKVVKD
ncbi:putative anaphase-promoting complex subunit [Phaeomoniella chlamydospora]|uniref:Anaphase-promoting complex subunit 2 n=1 Tax=Phaeomoniella chlamydospora TaxID=158046 RepID=A0A0G2ERH2_PHACM|nr:putative anaphase-promoting complex subunit [Phaeomoniella chlamydospora]